MLRQLLISYLPDIDLVLKEHDIGETSVTLACTCLTDVALGLCSQSLLVNTKLNAEHPSHNF